jgi:S-adenosyl methyltransferase
VIVSHTTEYTPNAEAVSRIYNQGGIRGGFRPADEFADLVSTGLTLVPSGVVLVSEWRPEPGAVRGGGRLQRRSCPQAVMRHEALPYIPDIVGRNSEGGSGNPGRAARPVAP